MRGRNKAELSLTSVIHAHRIVFALVFSALLSGVIACSSQKPNPRAGWGGLITVFDDRPFYFGCADRPSPLPPGTHAWVTSSKQAPYARTRLDTLDLPLYEVPALTIAANLNNGVQIAGANQDHWTVQYCAMGEGSTIDEANGRLQKVSMNRTGSLLTLDSTDDGGRGNLLLTAPAGAPLTVHSDAPVEIHDMAGPVRISTLGRAVVLNTTGRVDVMAMAVDFAGSQGSVFLNSSREIDVKLTAQQFHGTLGANAQGEVHVYFPPGFQSAVNALVDRPKDFVCHADFCSKIKKGREDLLYQFTYGDAKARSDGIGLRSMDARVVLETVQ